MEAAKKFSWEAAHRLPDDDGDCQNLHGHSYEMWIRVEGIVGNDGMVLNFREIKEIMAPVVLEFDHALLIAESDTELRRVAKQLGTKHVVLPDDTTSENLAIFFGNVLAPRLKELDRGITACSVKVQETPTCYAYHAIQVS